MSSAPCTPSDRYSPDNPERIALYQSKYVSTLVGYGYDATEQRAAFLKLMEGKEYGEGPLMSAWAWFCEGQAQAVLSETRLNTPHPAPHAAEPMVPNGEYREIHLSAPSAIGAPAEVKALRKFYAAWKEIKEYGGRYTMEMAEAEEEIEAASASTDGKDHG